MKIRLESGHSFIWNEEKNRLELLYEYDGGQESMEFEISKDNLKKVKTFFKGLTYNDKGNK